MKFMSNEEGRCPICNSQMIEYFGMELEDTAVYYPWHCPDCDTDGKEWYYVNFSEVRSNDDTIGDTQGVCPDCGAEIEYGTAEPEGNSLGYEYFCPECENSGTEWYDLDFDSHTINGHEDEEIDVVKESKSVNDIETELNSKVAQYKKLKKVNKDDTSKSKDLEDEIEDLEAQLKKLKKEDIDYKNDRYTATTAEDSEEERAYYGKNMTKRDKVRSLDQAKRNLDRLGKDPRVTQGQAVDQVSFDDKALDTDLSRYKTNKEWAKKSAEKDDEFWTDEHNKTAKQFADKIRAKHKKQEDIEDNEEENDINFEDTISLLDIALKEIPTIGVEDWGKDDELLFTADTKVMFENLKNYEEEIPKYYYDNASNDDWSNGIDSYLEEIKGVNLNDGDSDNTYNWNAPLTHDVEFTMYEADDGCYFKGSIHRTGDVRGNYTTEFLLKFNDKDDCLETLFDTCSENCYRQVTVDGVDYTVSPHFFNEYVDIWSSETQENYDDVYCDCIETLREIIAENKNSEE